jgi:hypothetical protein
LSQNEMTQKNVLKFILTTLISAMPMASQASIPVCYYPAYSLRLAALHTPSAQSEAPRSSRRAPASINHAAIMMATPSKIFYGDDGTEISPELIANFNQVKASDKPVDMAELIPMDMQPSTSSSDVFAKVADKSMTTFWNSPSVRESSIGRTATDVEQTMKQEVVINGDDPTAIQHKFNFNVQAFQTLAQIQYTGLTNAALKYKIAENLLSLEVSEKFLVVSHSIGRDYRLSEVNMRWTF